VRAGYSYVPRGQRLRRTGSSALTPAGRALITASDVYEVSAFARQGRICARHFPSGSGSGRDNTAGSGGGDEPVNNRRDLGWLLFGNPVSAVGDDAGGHVPAADFA
jgi:hypothetical protein